jgi:hypothetical protein
VPFQVRPDDSYRVSGPAAEATLARKARETIRRRPAMGEVEKFDRMEHRDRCAARDLRDAADVAGRDGLREAGLRTVCLNRAIG